MIRILSFKARYNGLSLEQEYDLINAASKIRFDERRLIQILLNLVSNAVKFTPSNGTIKIRARLIEAGAGNEKLLNPALRVDCEHSDLLEISVSDTGVGIVAEDMPKLFKMNGFLKRTEEINTRGIGLGLHICRKLVRKLGGNIICESEWQKGSTFTFTVKVDVVDDTQITQNKLIRLINPGLKRLFTKINIA